jgi:hypothetical protein
MHTPSIAIPHLSTTSSEIDAAHERHQRHAHYDGALQQLLSLVVRTQNLSQRAQC